MAKYVIDIDDSDVGSARYDLSVGCRLAQPRAAIANAIPLGDYLASQQPTPAANAVTVPLTTWIGPYGVTVSGFVPNAGFEVQVNQLREVIEDGWLGRDDKEQTHITASIAIPLPEPVTVVGKVEVTQ